MKKTIAALAMSASSTSFALMAPPQKTKTICLEVYENENGVSYAANCDSAANNVKSGVELLDNGCAANQIALQAAKYNGKYDISIRSCLPPNVAQL